MEKLARNEIMEHLIIEHAENVDAIYLDYAQAFDTVPHKRLLAKLSGYGIGEKLLKWIAAFLEGRRQRSS